MNSDTESEPCDDALIGRGLAEAARSGLTLREVEDLYISQVVALCGGRKVDAALRLGIDRKTLYRRERARLHRLHEQHR